MTSGQTLGTKSGEGFFTNAQNVNASGGQFNQIGRDQYNAGVMNIIQDSLGLEVLHPVFSACFPDEKPCQPGTRVDVLNEIDQWVRGKADDGVRIYWLTGTGGVGKTAITKTVCDSLRREKGKLVQVCPFFCSSEEDRDDPRRILPTIAFVLSDDDKFAEALKDSLDDDIDMDQVSFETQIEMTIIKPLRKVKAGRILIVIDALDQCDGLDIVADFIECISNNLDRLPSSVKFLFACRPHPYIRMGFNLFPQEVLKEHNLNFVDREATQKDIRAYLNYGFKRFGIQNRGRYVGWPKEEELDGLAKKSDGFFLYASAAFRNIVDSTNPKDELKKLVSASSSHGLNRIEMIYKHVSMDAVWKLRHERNLRNILEDVVGAVALVRRPLSVQSLADLLSLGKDSVRNILEIFHTVIPIPSNDEDKIHPSHGTWVHFITVPSQVHHRPFMIDTMEQHIKLALCCLRYMNDHLQEDSDLDPDDALRYSVNSWVDHLRKCERAGRRLHREESDVVRRVRRELSDEVESFCGYVDVWVNLRLREATRIIQNLPKLSEDLATCYSAMIEASISGPNDYSPFFYKLAATTQTRFIQTGKIRYVDQSISFLQKAQHIDTGIDMPLDEQTAFVQQCFELTVRTVDLEEAAKHTEDISGYGPSEYLTPATRCLLLMHRALKKDIFALSRYDINKDIRGLDVRQQKYLQGGIGDACYSWAKYLRLGSKAGNVRDGVEPLKHFVEYQFLPWLEVMSVSDGLESAAACLRDANAWLIDIGNPDKRLYNLISECEKFVDEFTDIISKSAPHIYHSALPWYSGLSFKTQYQEHLQHEVKMSEIVATGLGRRPLANRRNLGVPTKKNSQGYSFSSKNVWVIKGGKRVCWIPPSWRNSKKSVQGTKITLQQESGSVKILDFTAINKNDRTFQNTEVEEKAEGSCSSGSEEETKAPVEQPVWRRPPRRY